MDREDLYQQLNEALNPLDDAYHALRALHRMMRDELPMSPEFQRDCTAMLSAIVAGMHAALERLDRHIEGLQPSEDDGRQVKPSE